MQYADSYSDCYDAGYDRAMALDRERERTLDAALAVIRGNPAALQIQWFGLFDTQTGPLPNADLERLLDALCGLEPAEVLSMDPAVMRVTGAKLLGFVAEVFTDRLARAVVL